jgi:lipopolysaccharide/colanic/teichoic acid biosynthesis glycosyltransferase
MNVLSAESRKLNLSTNDWSSLVAARLPVSAAGPTPAHSGLRIPLWKRVIDVGVAVLSLPVVLPVSVLIMVWIKCLSPGPVLFRQKRIGFRGQSFTCFKFRSMHVRADGDAHRHYVRELMNNNQPMRKLDGTDPRLIPLGHLLRASGLDELPQLVNVLRGEMSLVGPRPCLPYEFHHYLPWQKRRCDVLPGLTGLWQVSGKNTTTFNQMIRLDLRYARDLSPWLDVAILLKTFGTLLRQVLESWAVARDSRSRDAAGWAPKRYA